MSDMKSPSKRGLGRGLSALFGEEETAEGQENGTAPAAKSGNVPPMFAATEYLKPNPEQPRKMFHPESLKALAESIKNKGLLQPILVRMDQGDSGMHYQIVAGERRWRAAQLAQLHEVPIRILEMNDSQTLEAALIENIHRDSLNPLEEGEGYQQLIETYNYTQEQVAKAVGKSRSHVSNLVRLINLPEEVKILLSANQLSMGHARALLSAKDPIALSKLILARELSVRQLEQIIQSENTPKTVFKAQKSHTRPSALPPVAGSDLDEQDPNSRALARHLSDQLGMDVSITLRGSDEAGSLSIRFTSLEQLDDLVELLNRVPDDSADGGFPGDDI